MPTTGEVILAILQGLAEGKLSADEAKEKLRQRQIELDLLKAHAGVEQNKVMVEREKAGLTPASSPFRDILQGQLSEEAHLQAAASGEPQEIPELGSLPFREAELIQKGMTERSKTRTQLQTAELKSQTAEATQRAHQTFQRELHAKPLSLFEAQLRARQIATQEMRAIDPIGIMKAEDKEAKIQELTGQLLSVVPPEGVTPSAGGPPPAPVNFQGVLQMITNASTPDAILIPAHQLEGLTPEQRRAVAIAAAKRLKVLQTRPAAPRGAIKG